MRRGFALRAGAVRDTDRRHPQPARRLECHLGPSPILASARRASLPRRAAAEFLAAAEGVRFRRISAAVYKRPPRARSRTPLEGVDRSPAAAPSCAPSQARARDDHTPPRSPPRRPAWPRPMDLAENLTSASLDGTAISPSDSASFRPRRVRMFRVRKTRSEGPSVASPSEGRLAAVEDRNGFLSYGLGVRLQLLSTSPLGDAVSFGYRPQARDLAGCCPPLTTCARRRT